MVVFVPPPTNVVYISQQAESGDEESYRFISHAEMWTVLNARAIAGIIARQPFQLLTTRRCLLHRHLTDDSEALYKELAHV